MACATIWQNFLSLLFPALFADFGRSGDTDPCYKVSYDIFIFCFTAVLYFNLCYSHTQTAKMRYMQFRHSGILKE